MGKTFNEIISVLKSKNSTFETDLRDYDRLYKASKMQAGLVDIEQSRKALRMHEPVYSYITILLAL